MLCSKFKQIILPQSTLYNHLQFRYFITSRIIFKKWVPLDYLLTSLSKKDMSPLRVILMDLRLWSGWTRSKILNTVVRRCRKDLGVKEVIQRFRHTFFRPRRTLLISATAAYKARGDDDDTSTPCDNSITNAELEELLKDLDAVEMLSRSTLFCVSCGKRLVIDKKLPGVQYCSCKAAEVSRESASVQSEGWIPYMEAEDVIIWRKEYKPGLGLYVYKVYGRYPDVRAEDFAAVQMDGGYRRHWDSAVASLAVVEQRANGLPDQAVLHWEVLWPRLFANRDYVYIRRHKEFDATDNGLRHREGLFQPTVNTEMKTKPIYNERPSVHSNAKRKAMEAYAIEMDGGSLNNKVYVIISRSCEHPDVPETKHAIRVYEYWSHMVVKTMYGADKCGMEFVLTYYDEPAVGGMPSGVAAWATGRAAPAYLQRMRRAAVDYQAWRHDTQQEADFTPFVSETTSIEHKDELDKVEVINELDMESTQLGPELKKAAGLETREQGTQTDDTEEKAAEVTDKLTQDKSVETEREITQETQTSEGDSTKSVDEDEPKTNGGWWRYLHPFYYFI